ncbi:endonuclease [Priestia megaterium]|uniref:Z1 domain-containing protein n=1 Tax=Priestia megaterium TaxID=1404 RepID=UPI000BFBCEA6|nr:Z1 domain-containing protein [Priestia megaterium]PGN62197.1 endonuclease [Priestia megaterium]
MNDQAKTYYESIFELNYLNFLNMFKGKENQSENAAEQAAKLAEAATRLLHGIQEDHLFESWAFEMYVKYKVGIEIDKATIMRAESSTSWFNFQDLASSFFWSRYKQYLLKIKSWPLESVQAIDETTNEVLESLGNPNSPEPFDKRGLVLGYVQSGKTANFTGLINKAYDLGYKLVIVLAGMHNDLRAQTQIRLEEEVIGSILGENDKPKGVAQIRANERIVSTWTTIDQDISNSSNNGITHLDQPTLMVVKKNKDVLEALQDQLNYHKKLYNLDIPVLIIDDEADQASVDTSDPDKSEDPKTINKLIRQILEIFNRKAYVGYTATPFANLLINVNTETQEEGKDLYPKDFIVGLPKPKGYCGPEEFFNVFEEEEYERPSLIRYLSKGEIDMFDSIKKKHHGDKFEEVPETMKEAILSFFITIAIRSLRGQTNVHNSMLIHTSRFKDVQSTIKAEVASEVENMRDYIQYNRKSKIVDQLRNLYYNDFIKTTKSWDSENEIFKWNFVYEEIKKIVEKIQVLEINGNSGEVLAYHEYKDKGLNVIAVGGDKLSRGLTLEGLSITYYYRNTLMYDTLMQMGRWFGYRKGYMDLCRIYTSGNIAEYFEHLAIAMVELRQEFDKLAKLNLNPRDYAIKMLSHPKMSLTSPLKMKNSEPTVLMYHDSLQQTRIFDKDLAFYETNMKATNNLISQISNEFKETDAAKTKYLIAKDIKVQHIIEFLGLYRTSHTAHVVNSQKLINYINMANTHNELINWTVAIVDGNKNTRIDQGLDKFPVQMGDIAINGAVIRGVNRKVNTSDRIDIGAIVAAKQEFIDLSSEEVRKQKDKNALRKMRPKENGVLLIYPLHPGVNIFSNLDIEFTNTLVPIGIALSFPGDERDSSFDKKKVYEKNKTVSDKMGGKL